MPVNNQPSTAEQDPPIILDAAHVDELEALASGAMRRAPELADRLLHEMARADVLPSNEMPANVVNLGSEVTYRDDISGAVTSVTLVLPAEADIDRRRASVLTPIGAALIGLAEGASISWQTRGGETRRLTVLAVAPRVDA